MRRLAVVLLLAAGIAFAQEAKKSEKPEPLIPTDEEKQVLMHEQHMVIYAMTALNEEAKKLPQFADWQKAIADLKANCEQVVIAHKWPKGTGCDMNTLQFTAPAPPAAPETVPQKPTEPPKKP